MQTEQVFFIITQDGNISLVLNGNTNSIGKSHPNYGAIFECLKTGNYDGLEGLVDIPKAVNAYMEGNVTVNEFGEVTYQGNQVDNVIATRITEFFKQGLPYQRLVRFLENLMKNPSGRSTQELYRFLEHHGLPITEDGCFVGYKGVCDDFMDKHSRTFDNTPGKSPRLAARNLVDDDANRDCSFGLHVGTQAYASQFAGSDGRVVLVKVNPADAVSVPHSDANKLRVVGYEVLREVEKTFVCDSPIYNVNPEPEPEEDYESEPEEDTCDDCGMVYCDCEEQQAECDEQDAMDAAYEAGGQAFNNRDNRNTNPHQEGDVMNDSWNQGWQDAADDFAASGGNDSPWQPNENCDGFRGGM